MDDLATNIPFMYQILIKVAQLTRFLNITKNLSEDT